LQYPEGQKFEPYLAPSAAVFFIYGWFFSRSGDGPHGGWFFSLRRDREKDVILLWLPPRPFFDFLVFQHAVAMFW